MAIILLFSAAPRLFPCIQKQPVFITSLPSLKVFGFFLSFHGLSHLIQTYKIWSLASNGEFERRVWMQSLTRSVCHVKPFADFQMRLLRTHPRTNKYHRLSPVPMWFPHNFAKNHIFYIFFTVTNVWRLNSVNASEIVGIWRRHTQDISTCASARGPFVTREGSAGCQVMPLDTFHVTGLDARGYWQVNMYLFSLAVEINCSHATEAVVSREVKEGY